MTEHPPITLFPQGAPGETEPMQEIENPIHIKVANQPVHILGDVSIPTITFYPAPHHNNTGATLIVNPGGGYDVLAYDLEGTEVCERFNTLGINCVLLKYRVPRRKGQPKHQAPLQDLQRAIAYTRAHAKEWQLDPNKIGVIGFSAGAFTAALASNNYNKVAYPPIDSYDELNLRPDFTILVYPAFLEGENFSIVPELTLTENTPPTLLIQAQTDYDYLNSSLFYYYALKEAKVSATMYLYPKGGHGFGVRNTGYLINEWPERAISWMKEVRVLKKW